MTTPATRLLATITAQFGAIETAAADPLDAVLRRDLKPDSLDVVELTMALEDEFQIVIDDDEAIGLSEQITLREILALVEARLARQDAAA